MSESRTTFSALRRILLPLIIAAVLVIGTVIISGSALIRIEDVTINRILAGTYGTPDWRVQEMNPLLAQLLTLLYRLLPAVNWYGGMLLALLVLAIATAIGLASRKSGALLPAAIIMSPVAVLLASSVISTTVCALCAAAGAFSLMLGISRRKNGIGQAVWGAVLFAFAVMLSLPWAIGIGIGAVLCFLPNAIRETRVRGFVLGLLAMAVMCAAFFGYDTLMYNSPELSAYRNDYALYERLQHSNLKDEADHLLAEYGVSEFAEDHDNAQTDAQSALLGITTIEMASNVPENSFDAVDWSLDDASRFFARYAGDSSLTDPEALRTLDSEACYWNFTASELFADLFATIKKPQFLMLIGLFIIAALATLITSRRRGLVVLLATLIAFGGHVLSLAHYYDSFADIAPFYLLAIVIMLFTFNGEDAKAWFKRVLTAPWLRIGLSALVLVVFVAGLGGLLYYTRITPANPSTSTTQAVQFLKAYTTANADTLFIGDNPNDRFKPNTLTAPVRGEDANLLAGTYDLYSPRAAALKETYEINNPMPDSVDRKDVAYIQMSQLSPDYAKMSDTYSINLKEPVIIMERPEYAERIYQLEAYTEAEIEEINKYAEEASAAWAEFAEDMNAMEEDEEDHTGHDHEAEPHEDEATAEVTTLSEPTAAITKAPSVTATPSATPRVTATPSPAPSATSNG